MAIDGHFEKFIIRGITTRHNPFGDCQRLRYRQRSLQPGMRGRSDEQDKIRPGRKAEELPFDGGRVI
jgi:hypothetical protein